MTDIYYELADGVGQLIFVLKQTSPNIARTRAVWDMPLPFVKFPFMTDQVTTTEDLTIEGSIKPGTGMPYATQSLALAAFETLAASTRSTGWTLKGGDWNGATWADNVNYPFRYAGTEKLLITMARVNPLGASYLTGEIGFTVNAKLGTVY